MTPELKERLVSVAKSVLAPRPSSELVDGMVEIIDAAGYAVVPKVMNDKLAQDAQAATLREAIGNIMAAAPHYMDDARKFARQALSTDAGKEAADVLAAVVAWVEGENSWEKVQAIYDAGIAYRAKGQADG